MSIIEPGSVFDHDRMLWSNRTDGFDGSFDGNRFEAHGPMIVIACKPRKDSAVGSSTAFVISDTAMGWTLVYDNTVI